MKRRSWIFVFGVLFMSVFFSRMLLSQEQESAEMELLKVQEFAFCEKVEEREPVSTGEEFSSDIGRVYLWTSIYGAEQPTTIKHIWYYENNKMNEVPLSIKYKRTRTWSYKNIMPEWTGDWHVDVVDEKGNVLKKLSFKIIE